MKKIVLWAIAVSSLSFDSLAQTDLQTAEVEAFRIKAPEKLVTGAVYSVDSTIINSHGSSDMSRALNAIPGVKMETRGEGGSRRIHVRGSSLRSQYSIRNSMLLIDGFVFTEADGNSPIEWLDPDLVSNMSVITGPAAASYGGAYGGAFLVNTISPNSSGEFSSIHQRISATGRTSDYSPSAYTPNYGYVGKQGLQSRLSYNRTTSNQFGNFSLSVILSENPGFRDWEWNFKDQVYFKNQLEDKKQGVHTFIGGYFSGAWALPGSINDSIANVNPTQSPGINYNAHVERNRSILGYKYNTSISEKTDITFSLLGRYTKKLNPYGTSNFYQGFKDEIGYGGSAMLSLSRKSTLNERWKLCTEFSLMHIRDENNMLEYDSFISENPAQTYNLDFSANQTFASTSLVITDDNKLRAEAQIGANNRARTMAGMVNYSEEYNYDVENQNLSILPRFGISYMPYEKISFFSQISTGFSDPTAFEIFHPDDRTLSNLEFESALGKEIGVNLYPSGKLRFKTTFYHQIVDNAISQYTTDSDATAFENIDDGLVMSGVETEFVRTTEKGFCRGFATITKHRFGLDSEKTVPGTPKFSSGLQYRRAINKIIVSVDYRYVGKTHLDNNNEHQLDPYSVVDLSAVRNLKGYMIELGVRNALNTEYSNWPQLNAFGRKYYNPAPPSTLYFSLRKII